MKRILDRSFHYVPSYQTDLRRTFERLRREQRGRGSELVSEDTAEKVLHLPSRKAAQ
jgi:hypothetical protein